MATEFSLQASRRTAGHPNRDRAQGRVPAVMYGHGVQPLTLGLDAHEFALLLSRGGAHHVLRLDVDGEPAPRTVVVKEIQHHPVSRKPLHVDFQAVSALERIHAEVPVHIEGAEQVSRRGGVLQVVLHHLRVSCLPADLPEQIVVDVSALDVGEFLTVAQVAVPAGVAVLAGPEEVLVSVGVPRAAEPEATATPATPAEGAAPAEG